MPTIKDTSRDVTALSDAEREWLRRQGRAARALEAQQRCAVRRAGWRSRPAAAGRKRSRSA